MAMHPDQLAEFEILRRLGAGGMAEVFLAKKRGAEGTYKLLVVKRVLPVHGSSRRFRTMFVEEAHLATRLNHPNIVQVYEFSDHGDEGLLLSMEYVEGFDLGKIMSAAKRSSSRLPPFVAAYIVSEAAKGLHYAHERKDEGGVPLAIVHRDVSPQNILVAYDGAVKIADFGIASANLFREEPGVLKGKFAYMSPEQARGDRVDRRSDIYALGVVFYELLALRSPYGKLADEALLEAVKSGSYKPPSTYAPDVPPELEAIILRAMRRAPEERFGTAREMSAAIARTLLAKQELIDNASIEAMLMELFGRELELPAAGMHETSQAATLAAVPLARTPSEGTHSAPPARVAREVRHVAVVTLRIDSGIDMETAGGKQAARRAGASIRATLDDIAFKRGAVWSWESPWSARAVVGLMANPSRAAADAASLAIDVHEALAGASEDQPAPLSASIGIVRGIASGERDDQGHLVRHTLQEPSDYLADRVGAATPFGRTWVAGGVYRLVRRDFRWGEAPSLELREAGGHRVPAQMRLYALERPLTREERMSEHALAQSDLVGRDAEKADLQTAYHRAVSPPLGGVPGSPPSSQGPSALARSPRGELVARVVVGEMGIGKTALVSTFLSELPSGARVVQVECSPVKIELPLATVADVLREVTGMGLDNPLEEAQAALTSIFGPVARLPNASREILRLAELVTGKQHSEPHEEDAGNYRHDLVVQGLRHLLGALAADQPLVMVVDGLQWADRASLELLKELLRRSQPLAILAVLVTRPEERVIPYIEGLVRIELKGLEPEEQVRLVEARLGVRDGVAAVCGELVPRVAGNPFFLLEMVDALLERGTLEIVEREDGRHELVRHERPGERSEALPQTLEQLIGDRLRELPLEEHDVVDWLAVAGGPLSESDILALARLPDDEAITRLCARGLCDRRTGAIDFRHPLARDVAYLALDPPKRSRMHLALGEHLLRTPLARGLPAAIVARHLARGEASVPAAEMYLEAAGAARSAHQEQLALRYYVRALALLPPEDPRRIGAHASLEAIYRHLGRRQERRKHLLELRRLARQSGKARWAALALVRTARLDCDDGHLARGLPVAQRAAEVARIARQPALEVEAFTILAEILGDLGDVQGAIDACERALRVAQSAKLPPRLRAEVLRSKGVLLRRVGRVEEAAMAHAEAIAVFRAVGARRSEARAKNALAYAMFVMERFEDAIALGLASIGIDLDIGGRFQIAKTLSNVGQAYARLGDTERGLSYLKRAREAHERYADQDSRADTLLCSAEILLETGNVFEAAALCGDAGALVAATGSAYDTVHERIVRALLARAEGRPGEAVAHAQAARKLAEPQGLLSYHIYATAIEAAARVDAGEQHTGVLLARTALGAIEATSSSEYGIEVRALCCDALRKGMSTSGRDALLRTSSHVRRVADHIRDPRLRSLFLRRPVVERILSQAEGAGAGLSPYDPLSRGGTA
ncbi:serine/threonine-protein kinase PknK [Polyangium aurulentum]|uniref:serine/threonine-protein kinase n=1 Tax=Polyangium aurulentum TaxID=2567896 RepID=UPI00146EF271|nr:serine/threonine-protein kinase [Polyangium aurulentum]UQA55925.1 protein kinase [Polyangium aurulentum]